MTAPFHSCRDRRSPHSAPVLAAKTALSARRFPRDMAARAGPPSAGAVPTRPPTVRLLCVTGRRPPRRPVVPAPNRSNCAPCRGALRHFCRRRSDATRARRGSPPGCLRSGPYQLSRPREPVGRKIVHPGQKAHPIVERRPGCGICRGWQRRAAEVGDATAGGRRHGHSGHRHRVTARSALPCHVSSGWVWSGLWWGQAWLGQIKWRQNCSIALLCSHFSG